jgi:hypothetical protein
VTTVLGIGLAGLGAWIAVRSGQSAGLAPFLMAGGLVLVFVGIFVAGG